MHYGLGSRLIAVADEGLDVDLSTVQRPIAGAIIPPATPRLIG
jgi:hypothetical protein